MAASIAPTRRAGGAFGISLRATSRGRSVTPGVTRRLRRWYFFLFGALSFLATRRDPDFSELAAVSPGMRHRIESRIRWWEEINEANQIESTAIFTHNIR